MSRAAELDACIAAGGVALFPADTVYGLACDPGNAEAVERLYMLKRRPPEKASAVMFFSLEAALATLPGLGSRTRAALTRLLPGALTILLENPERRFPLASAADPDTLGLRVVDVPSLSGAQSAVLQSSANLSGQPAPRALAAVAPEIRAGVDLIVDGGELPGVASTVVDLREYEAEGGWRIVRRGAVSEEALAAALDWQFHFDPTTYEAVIRAELPNYERLQEVLAAAAPSIPVHRILELGTGTGGTAARLLGRHPEATLVGIDVSPSMLDAARARLPASRVQLRAARLQEPLPEGPFELVASALCVHHLTSGEKADLFARIRAALAPGGRFALADVVVPDGPAGGGRAPRAEPGSAAAAPLTPGYDKPDTVSDQLDWLRRAGFAPDLLWAQGDLAVIVADRR